MNEPPSGTREVATDYADVVVGGQAGSEGKGAVVAHLVRTNDYAAAVRPGSSNAGHTVYAGRRETPDSDSDDEWESYVHQVLPTAATVSDSVNCYMAPESSFGLDEFFEEVQDMTDRWSWPNAAERVAVDPKAAVITDDHRHEERDRKLGADIGSTVHGCGAVRVEKIWRSAGNVRLAEQYKALDDFDPRAVDRVGDEQHYHRVPAVLNGHGRAGESVMVEGTQGTLLSMNQSPHWPFSTSRDCTASAFLSSCGLAPSAARNVWAVFRTYPIRVGGHSGPMDGEEIDFETIADRAGHTDPPVEFTSVTKKKRRVFEWSWEQFDFALRLNDPDYVALTFLDYWDADNYGADRWGDLSEDTQEKLREINDRAEKVCGARLAMVKTGPLPDHAIDFRYAGSDDEWHAGGLPSVGEDPGDWSHHPQPGRYYAASMQATYTMGD